MSVKLNDALTFKATIFFVTCYQSINEFEKVLN